MDLRNHGKSAELDGFLPPHNLENAAKDLANLVRSQGWDWPDVVVGHSMGGKVALQFAQSCANGDYGDINGLPKQVIPSIEAISFALWSILQKETTLFSCLWSLYFEMLIFWIALDFVLAN